MSAKDLTTAPESLFWYWISERHAIYLRRQAGQPKPWTNDQILREYKFTNPFRENDRGTVWLRKNFLEPHRDDDLGLIAGNICWYRMFNWWGTGDLLGWQTSWNANDIKDKLHAASESGRQVFTGAHIVYSPPGRWKINAITDVCADLWRMCQGTLNDPPLHELARNTRSLEEVYHRLREVYCVGGFMAYEMVTDMRHTRLLQDATDIMTWANPGPGAKRGLRRLGLPSTPDAKAIESMRGLLSRAPAGLAAAGVSPISGNEDWPVVEMRDIEHSLCEFDKYCRVKFGEGEPRSRFPGGA